MNEAEREIFLANCAAFDAALDEGWEIEQEHRRQIRKGSRIQATGKELGPRSGSKSMMLLSLLAYNGPMSTSELAVGIGYQLPDRNDDDKRREGLTKCGDHLRYLERLCYVTFAGRIEEWVKQGLPLMTWEITEEGFLFLEGHAEKVRTAYHKSDAYRTIKFDEASLAMEQRKPRNQIIPILYAAGFTQEEIGQQYGISKARVGQILNRGIK